MIVYFWPSLPAGRPFSIGSGDWPNAAGNTPVYSVSLLASSMPLNVIGLLSPGPVIEASEGPLANAVGASRAATQSTNRRRFIGELLSRGRRLYTGRPG